MHFPAQRGPLNEEKLEELRGSFIYIPLNLGKLHALEISIQIMSPRATKQVWIREQWTEKAEA